MGEENKSLYSVEIPPSDLEVWMVELASVGCFLFTFCVVGGVVSFLSGSVWVTMM